MLDPHLETADADRSNNYWPPRIEPIRMKLNKHEELRPKNPMQLQKETEKATENADEEVEEPNEAIES